MLRGWTPLPPCRDRRPAAAATRGLRSPRHRAGSGRASPPPQPRGAAAERHGRPAIASRSPRRGATEAVSGAGGGFCGPLAGPWAEGSREGGAGGGRFPERRSRDGRRRRARRRRGGFPGSARRAGPTQGCRAPLSTEGPGSGGGRVRGVPGSERVFRATFRRAAAGKAGPWC